MANLGFVGLGVMGSRVVKRLLDAGHRVVGYNRTRSKADWLLAEGMQWGETACAVAEASEITFSMVTNTEALHAVTEGSDGILAGLRQGNIYVDMSTASPTVSRELAARVAQIEPYHAPSLAQLSPWKKGKLIMVGEPQTFERLSPSGGDWAEGQL
jgi:3-hydroxyisobutyrate dehydrogenase-like beta-hydroxyacid dehydrogenase